MLDHPVTQKAMAAIVGATVIGIGSLGWNAGVRVKEHDIQLQSLKEQQVELKTDVVRKLDTIGTDVGSIKTDVAVLKERTERDDEPKRPRP